MRLLYKLLTPPEWDQLQRDGHFAGAEVDLRDGFIHFSYSDQLHETARKHFAGRGNLVLAAVSPTGLEDQLRDEVSRGGALFPHLYGMFYTGNIVWSQKIVPDDNGIPVIGVVPDRI